MTKYINILTIITCSIINSMVSEMKKTLDMLSLMYYKIYMENGMINCIWAVYSSTFLKRSKLEIM